VPLTASYPAVSVLLSYALLNERPNVSQWVGAVFVIVGTILLLSGPTASISQERGTHRNVVMSVQISTPNRSPTSFARLSAYGVTINLRSTCRPVFRV